MVLLILKRQVGSVDRNLGAPCQLWEEVCLLWSCLRWKWKGMFSACFPTKMHSMGK